jgi:predicted ATPase/class 3 adenylate cyclase
VRVSTGDPPSGVVTFLFTDIEGSTRRWETDAQSMRSALLAHDEVLRSAIELHEGFLFSHTGDGVVAAFASPKAAVDAAVAAQRELQLPVRMGIATGEAELRDGDYFGTVLNRAARVMAAGHGGQILVAESTAGLLSGVDLLDLGPRRLRDVPMPVGVFQLRAPGLPEDFPPLRTLDASSGNLRPAVTKLIGRNYEVTELATAVCSRRLVTLTGVGGVGKTRLALEVAAEIVDEFPDGVWVFELAAVSDAGAVPDAVAAVLGVTQQPGKSVSESVVSALEGRVRLLVFDNCEHVLDAAADLIEAILTESSSVRVLATSREGLDVANEQIWPVRSLEVDAAAELFMARAHSVAPGFTADDAGAVMEICRRLDGIPLAIELAASRISSMTLDDVRDRLDRRFKLLVGSRRSLERHQTLRHAVQWSYDLLDDAEKALLERCSVFAGGFEIQSVCAVAGSGDPDDFAVMDLLHSLVRKSLLVADRSAARIRFSMLETIRQFAEEQLVAGGEADSVRTAHTRHFADREAEILALWDSPRQRESYTWFFTELANLRSAFRWGADRGDLDDAATIATYAGILAFMLENHEPVAWAEELIETARAVDHPRLASLYVVAALSWIAGRVDDALTYVDAGMAMRTAPGEVPFGFDGLLGGIYTLVGQLEKAVDWFQSHMDPVRDPLATIRANRVLLLPMVGRADEAMDAAADIVKAAETTGNPYALTYALLAYGYAFRGTDIEAALAAMRRGLTIAHESGNRTNESFLALNVGHLEARLGDTAAALEHLTRAVRIYHDSGSPISLRSPLAVLAALLDQFGHHKSAATIAGFADSPLTAVAFPELTAAITHLRDVLGDETYESLARIGEAMTTAAVATYAYDQIDQARAELNGVSK